MVESAALEEGDPQTLGNHIKVHFRMDGARMVPTAILAVENAEGDLVMYAYVDDDRVYVSDGATGSVDHEPIQLATRPVGGVWHRLDVVLDGDEYTIHLDQKHNATARAFTSATAGTWVADPRPLLGPIYEAVSWARPRADDGRMAYDETFGKTTTTWEQVVHGGVIDIFPEGPGHQAPGLAQITGPLALDTTYLRAPVDGHDGAFTAEVSIAARASLDTPVGLAALAGLRGPAHEPEVQWALVADHVLPGLHDWALFLEDADGHRTQVSAPWRSGWHHVEMTVDEAAGTVSLRVDGGTPLVLAAALGTSTHVGAGDVFAGLHLPSGATARFDGSAVYPEAGA